MYNYFNQSRGFQFNRTLLKSIVRNVIEIDTCKPIDSLQTSKCCNFLRHVSNTRKHALIVLEYICWQPEQT